MIKNQPNKSLRSYLGYKSTNGRKPDTTRVESTGVLNNHETFFLKIISRTDRQTGAPVEVPPVLKKEVHADFVKVLNFIPGF